MGKKRETEVDPSAMTAEERMKWEIAEEIGVSDKVLAGGWRSLTAKESGRIGGLMTRRKKLQKTEVLLPEGENRE